MSTGDIIGLCVMRFSSNSNSAEWLLYTSVERVQTYKLQHARQQ